MSNNPWGIEAEPWERTQPGPLKNAAAPTFPSSGLSFPKLQFSSADKLTTETYLNSCCIIHCCGEYELVQQFGKSIWQYISKLRNAEIFLSRNSTSRNSTYRYTYLCADWHICKTGYCSLICESKEEGVPRWCSWLSNWLLVLAQIVISWTPRQALRPAWSLLKILCPLHSALPSLSCSLSKINK